jgi:hypothetical protein
MWSLYVRSCSSQHHQCVVQLGPFHSFHSETSVHSTATRYRSDLGAAASCSSSGGGYRAFGRSSLCVAGGNTRSSSSSRKGWSFIADLDSDSIKTPCSDKPRSDQCACCLDADSRKWTRLIWNEFDGLHHATPSRQSFMTTCVFVCVPSFLVLIMLCTMITDWKIAWYFNTFYFKLYWCFKWAHSNIWHFLLCFSTFFIILRNKLNSKANFFKPHCFTQITSSPNKK